MKTFQIFVISVVLAVLVVSNIASFAVSSPTILSVKTDKKIINVDNSVTISGYVSPSIIKHGQDLLIQVFNPVGELYLSDSLNVTKSLVATGTYFYGFDFNGKPAIPGNYEIMMTYGNYDVETIVTYLTGNDNPDLYYSYVIQAANQTYPVRYKITQGNEVESMSLDSIANLLRVGVNSDVNNGTLTIEIPRIILDSTQNGADLNYTAVIVHGTLALDKSPISIIETNTSHLTRTLQVGLENGTQEIWIYGTKTGISNQLGNMTVSSSNALPLPLQQMRSGILPQDVKCRYGFVHVIKSEDGFPACIHPDDLTKLVQRGWAKVQTLS